MSADELRDVAVPDWLTAATDLVADGLGYLDVLAGVDRGDAVEVVARLVDPERPGQRSVRLVTQVGDGDALPSLTALLPAAGWHERELAEMFGVQVVGHPGLRPLLRRQHAGRPPLRRSTVLAARVGRTWPGATEASGGGSRRRQAPPGVAVSWLDEDDA